MTDDVNELKDIINRYQKKYILMKKVVEVYRKGVQSLYADGSSYSSLQFRGLRNNSSSRRWIEKEVYLMTSCLSSDVDVLEKICRNLYQKIRQSESYSLELQVRVEETLKEFYKGRNSDEFLKQQCLKLSEEVRQSKLEISSLTEELIKIQIKHREKEDELIDQLTKQIQEKDELQNQFQRSNELTTFHEEINVKENISPVKGNYYRQQQYHQYESPRRYVYK